MKLCFNKDGKFRILHMTDMQESAVISPDTVKLIKTSIKKIKPDLVVLTGDQIKSYAIGLGGKNAGKTVAKMIKSLCSPMEEAGVPFAATFGNHDVCKYVSKEDQIKMYSDFSMFVRPTNGAYDQGTYALPVYSSDGEKVKYLIYIIDSQGNRKGGGYEAVKPDQIEWYRAQRDNFAVQNQSAVVPSMAFQHIPVCEMYGIFKRVPKRTKNSVRCYRTHAKEFYILDEEKCFEMNSFKEPASVPDENTGEFNAMKEKGDIKAIFCGHDHKNSFVGTNDGIDLGYTPSSGFNTYGDGLSRGSREIVISEDGSYITKAHTFAELCGTRVLRPFQNAALKFFPTTVDDGIHKGFQILLFLIVTAAIIVGIIFGFKLL